jgi:glutamate N-acetyltransferase/amino-acid N-acetyltransferase
VSVTAASGWSASGIHAGFKTTGEPDLALVLAESAASVAAAFTTNAARAAHIHVCLPRVLSGHARGVVVNSGIANASTGAAGIEDATRLAALAAAACDVPAEEMLVCSTGKIGHRMPIDAVASMIEVAAKNLSRDGAEAAARAIMTTDTRPKQAAVLLPNGVTVGGMAKGAGMIAPDMQVAHATMLAFITTDATASAEWLRTVMGRCLPATFNAITVDGSMSTNDTVLLFANGASGIDADGSLEFATAVDEVMRELAYAIVADGEGATKVIRIRVSGAGSDADAKRAARAVADSMLFRAAIWGGDPNWGRVVQSIGALEGISFDPARTRVSICGVDLAVAGEDTGRKPEAAGGLLASEILVEADLGMGAGAFEYLTCDLTPEYVRLQADT